jgi:hypothetical protein
MTSLDPQGDRPEAGHDGGKVFLAYLLAFDEILTPLGTRVLWFVLLDVGLLLLWLVLSSQFALPLSATAVVAGGLVLAGAAAGLVPLAGPPRFRRPLVRTPWPKAVFLADSIEIHLPGEPLARIPWASIAMLRVDRSRGHAGELVDEDGRVIARLPYGLVTGNWSSFAQAAARLNPTRYRLAPGRLGKPLEFRLR